MRTAWFVFSIAILIECVWTFIGTRRFKDFFALALRINPEHSGPPVAVIASCKGLEPDLKANIESWFQQKYSNYRIFFVVESDDDEALKVIDQFPEADRFIAGPAERCGQKIHNLRFVISRLPEDYKILAFVDSDARLRSDWLGSLVQSLIENPDDAVTGYRWFCSESNFASRLRSVWNSSILSLFEESGKRNFAWGGSMAIFRKCFDDAKVFSFWEGSLSDDYGLTHAMNSAGKRVHFVPRSIALTYGSISLGEFLGWAGRQLLITRFYRPSLWWSAFIYHLMWLLWIISGVLTAPITAIFLFFIVQIIQGFKADIRIECIKLWAGGLPLSISRISYWTLSPLVGLVNASLLIHNLFARTVRWRGIEYQIKSRNHLEIKART